MDLVLFSATKYLSGHGHIVAGVASGWQDLIDQLRWYRDTTGPVMDGNTALLLRRSPYTLRLHMARVNADDAGGETRGGGPPASDAGFSAGRRSGPRTAPGRGCSTRGRRPRCRSAGAGARCRGRPGWRRRWPRRPAGGPW
ncbi:hypothetical protein DKG34_09685 [Streptomyces sp. NWU49]|nr:hypothetical protein DKG34_09685 [Streptomyces sp. NWU49]